MQQKLLDNEFSLEDFRDQLQQIRKLGPLENLLKMMPGFDQMKGSKDMKVDEKELTRIVAIVDSMTPKERRNHEIINGSRRRRIAAGSGTTVQDVNNLLKQYQQARKMMRHFTGGLQGGMLPKRLAKMKLPPGFPGFGD
jgi:signal recognition particle subunit SRP54